MFESRNVPCYLESLGIKYIKVGKDKLKGTKLTLRVDPLTPTLAAELDGVKGICFRRNDAEVNPNVNAVDFAQQPKPQTLELRPDPSLARPSVTLPEVRVHGLKARKAGDGSQWVFRFSVEIPEIGADDLLYLKDALFEMRYVTMADSQGGLFTEAEAEARRESTDAAPVKPGRSEPVEAGVH